VWAVGARLLIAFATVASTASIATATAVVVTTVVTVRRGDLVAATTAITEHVFDTLASLVRVAVVVHSVPWLVWW
jgi:hypothetical protein